MKKKKKEVNKTKKTKKTKIHSIFIRYIILILLAFGNLWLFYAVFFYLTTYPLLFLFKLFHSALLIGNLLIIDSVGVELINACIAGSAYYLLLILNLTTPMQIKKRLCSLAFSFFILLVLNILRIFILSILFLHEFNFFDFTHKLFWYALSTIFVVGIWFLTVKAFKIKAVPIYSDFKEILKLSRLAEKKIKIKKKIHDRLQ